jgi:DNA-binding CsgD family transcriptional regulator
VLTHRQIAAVARVGMLAHEPDTVSAATEALRVLASALHCEAATVVGLSPLTGEHLPIAEHGYAPVVNRVVAAEFTGTPWHREVMRSPLPTSISADPGQEFRRGEFYQRFVEPAGFRDGMTGALRQQGRYVGLVHLSASRPDAFGAEARHLLGGALPALAGLADLTGRACRAGDIPAGEPAALTIGTRVVALPERDRPPMLGRADFDLVLEAFAGAPGDRLRFFWALGRQWFRVLLVRQPPLPCGPAARPVLVHARPTPPPYGLSARELDVLTRVALGQSNPAIAQALFLSPRTVHSHVEHIMRKTGTASRIEAAALAIRESLLRPEPDLPQARLAW